MIRQVHYALFDFDQTLCPWDTQLLFCNFIIRQSPWRVLYLPIFILALLCRRWLGTLYLKRVFLLVVWGIKQEKLQQYTNQFADMVIKYHLYNDVVALLKNHQQQGHRTVLMSASPELWIAPIGKKLGFDIVISTPVLWRKWQRFQIIPLAHNNKKMRKIQRLRRYLRRHYQYIWDGVEVLEDSVGYSDSLADVPMLNCCQQQILIHPTKQLARYAEHHWHNYQQLTPHYVKNLQMLPRTKKDFIWGSVLQAVGLFRMISDYELDSNSSKHLG